MTTQKLTSMSHFAWIAITFFVIGCTKAPTANQNSSNGGTSSSKYIYVASGSVYAGNGVTASTPSKTIAKYDIDGNYVGIVKDYSSIAADSPASIINYDSTRLVTLIENTAGRRTEYVTKDVGGVTTIFSNITNLNAVVRAFKIDYSGQFLISKTSAIEKLQFSGNQSTGSVYVSMAATSCGTLNTLIADIAIAPTADHIIFSHAAASPNNKIVILKKTGFTTASDCLASSPAAPTVNHYPTALLMHSSGVLFVAYSNATGAVHQIYAFNPTFTATTASFGTTPAGPALNDLSLAQGISRMTEMPDGSILVASAAPTMNVIERFTYNSSTGLLSRVGSAPFIGPTIFTRSISGMVIAD